MSRIRFVTVHWTGTVVNTMGKIIHYYSKW